MPIFMLPHRIKPYLSAAAFLAASGRLPAQAPAADGDIRGPKPLVEIPVPPQPNHALWIGIGIAILLALIAWFLWWKLRSRNKSKSPREIALDSLGELERTGTDIPAEAFANRAAGTLRQYIASRFGIAAPRRTTEEFLRDLASDSASPLAAQDEHLKLFLKSCDLAKFAGSALDENQRIGLVQTARDFIVSTTNPDGRP
jgi:hypothetical protein